MALLAAGAGAGKEEGEGVPDDRFTGGGHAPGHLVGDGLPQRQGRLVLVGNDAHGQGHLAHVAALGAAVVGPGGLVVEGVVSHRCPSRPRGDVRAGGFWRRRFVELLPRRPPPPRYRPTTKTLCRISRSAGQSWRRNSRSASTTTDSASTMVSPSTAAGW